MRAPSPMVGAPWNIEISYKLDGKAVAPEELGGASGQLEIAIKTSKNEAVSGGFYDNYLLQFTITLDADLCENVAVTAARRPTPAAPRPCPSWSCPAPTGTWA